MTEHPIIGGKQDGKTYRCAAKKPPLSVTLNGDRYLLFQWSVDPKKPRSAEVKGYIFCGMKIADGIKIWRERQ